MAESQRQSRFWLIGGILLGVILICIAGLFFVASQYRDTMTAYAWIQNANQEGGDLDAMVCENGAQAQRFGSVFRSRYGSGANISIDLAEFEQRNDRVEIRGAFEFNGDVQDYRAIFYIGDGDTNGFLGLLGCIARIEQLEPDTIPQDFWGR